jgi:hypothetical protein
LQVFAAPLLNQDEGLATGAESLPWPLTMFTSRKVEGVNANL